MRSKFFLALMAFVLPSVCWAAGQQASASSDPSPAVTNKPVTVTVTTNSMGNDVYAYTWCIVSGAEVSPFTWDAAINAKFKMTAVNGGYQIRIDNIQQFYGLTDSQMEGLTELGFIARTSGGAQTDDTKISVVQGRKTAYSGGEGTASAPFLLSKTQDLKDLAEYPADWAADIYLKLTANIAAPAGVTIGSIGSPFKAHFDGDGYTISDLSVSQTALGQAAGLFGAIDGADIKGVAVTNASVEGQAYVGILVGYAISGKIDQCYTTGSVDAKSLAAGGLVGLNTGATITNCYSTADVNAADQYAAGGLVGKNLGTVNNSYATGEVRGKNYIGGMVGANYGSISNSVAVNEGVLSTNEYVARFGGNNNPENRSTGNMAWNGITSSQAWTQHGDHSVASSDLHAQDTYSGTLGWQFPSIWKWENKEGKEFPVLAIMKQPQANPFPESFYSQSAIDNIGADSELTIRVWPNPVVDMLNVEAPRDLESYRIVAISGADAGSGSISGNSVSIDFSHLSPGAYVLNLRGADQIYNHIIIKR